MKLTVTDPDTNWSFDCITDPAGKPPAGGLVLQNITHGGHNFAKDIRVIGFWIETEVVDPSGAVVSTAKTFYVLDSATFTVSTVATLTPKPSFHPKYGKTWTFLKEAEAALDFEEYFKEPSGNYVAYGVSAKFDGPGLLSSFPNCEYADLSVEQIFLFSRYSNSPSHEPSGALFAARFHPLVRYKFSKNSSYIANKRFTRVSSIRFDYRLHLFLDRHHDVATNAPLTQFGNQAGLFADSDSVAGSGIVFINTYKITSAIFDAMEKPVVLEVTAPGLIKGLATFTTLTTGGSPRNVRCWDNMHWWGMRGSNNPLISTPGAFHCAHLHWRWGSVVQAAGVGSNPRFNPSTWPAGISVIQGTWGPLVDPGIWIQSLNVAVVKNDPSLDPNKGIASSALSKNDWKSLFNPGLRPSPHYIASGDDIVLWYSVEVHREVTVQTFSAGAVSPTSRLYRTSASSGTVFIHGIFFAHDAEKTGLKVGSTTAEHRPTSEASIQAAKQWFRSAN